MKVVGGFTLIELLVVMAIMAAMTAALPFFGGGLTDRVRLDYAAQDIMAVIDAARVRSVTYRRPISLSVDDLQRTAGPALKVALKVGDRDALSLQVYPDQSTSGGVVIIRRAQRFRMLAIDALTGAPLPRF